MTKKRSSSKKTRAEKLSVAVETATFDEYVARLRALHDAGAPANALKANDEEADPAETWGACLIKSPGSGQMMCLQTTQATCKTMKGSFVGGSCA